MIKVVLLLIFPLLIISRSVGQNVGIGTLTPDPSSKIDVVSTTSGLLIPRMTTQQRTDIISPAQGLMVYDKDTNTIWFYNTTAWTNLSSFGWLLTGNSGTNPTTSFIGTTDNKSLTIKVNNVKGGYIGAPINDGNVFWGYQSGLNNTGYSNVGIGIKALFTNPAVSNLVGIGDSALYNNTTGFNNTAVGSKALYTNSTGSGNTANGYQALYANSTGGDNTANGYHALYANTSGGGNTANGYIALVSNSTGARNTANGMEALMVNQSGSNNTATGYRSLYHNSVGVENTGNGALSLFNNSGTGNCANGFYSLWGNVSGSSNTAAGYYSLGFNVGGNNNTALGSHADVAFKNLNNVTVLGADAFAEVSNKVRIGNTSVTVIEGQVAYSFPSDVRFKYDIQKNVPGLDFITKLTPVTYFFDDEKLDEYTRTGIVAERTIKAASYGKEKQLHTGFLAQDVEKIAKAIGYNFDGIHAPANERGHYSLAYSQFIMPLVKAVQEQQYLIENLSRQVANSKVQITLEKQQQQIEKQNDDIDLLKAQVRELNKQLQTLTGK